MSQGDKKQTEQQSKQKILLDTNIFSDLQESNIAQALANYLEELIKRGFDFALSSITIYELLKGLSKKREEEVTNFLTPYFRYFVSDEVLIASAQLDNLFKTQNINVNSVYHGDKMIAATAILTGSLILTANVRDFPWPFFHETECKSLYFTGKNKHTQCHLVSLLRPDFELIKKSFEARP